MKITVRLHEDYYNVLHAFGELNDVVNTILNHCSAGDITCMNKPQAPAAVGTCKYEIDVTNEDYLNLLQTYGARSSRISLRRLLYWFVDMEIYNELNFTVSKRSLNDLRRASNDRAMALLNKIIQASQELAKIKGECIAECQSIISIAADLCNKL